MRIRIAVSLVLAVVGLATCLQAQPAFTDANWIGLGGYAGVNGTISATAVDTNAGLVYFGGSFTVAGRSSASNIVAWDGANWLALGLGMNSNVYCLVSDGAGRLYVGGNFTKAGGVAANRIAKWDGTNWSALGAGTDGQVSALAIDPAGNLYAGGSFVHAGGIAASNIAKWDGASWSSVGKGMNGSVLSLGCDSSGNLFAGGFFSQAGGSFIRYIARWDGTNWNALGSGLDAQALALAVDNVGVLYAGGYFQNSGTNVVGPVARWDGTNWHPMHATVGEYVYALAVDRSGNLFAGGGYGTDQVGRWDGTNWANTGYGASGGVYALATDASGVLYAGGNFNAAGSVEADAAARWDGTNWTAPNSGVVPWARVTAAIVPDGAGKLYIGSIGSWYSYANPEPIPTGTWDGTHWVASALGSPKTSNPTASRPFNALTFDRSGDMYAGGAFTNIGGVTAQNVAKRNGTNWSALGSGCEGPVLALATDRAGNLFAGGAFAYAGNTLVNNVAKWDGTNWSALGAGLNNVVEALTVDPMGNVHAGMYSYSTNGPVTFAKWDGTGWSPEATALTIYTNNGPFSITVDAAGRLYVGGDIRTSGVLTNGIARWDGTNWSTLGSGVGIIATAVACDDNGHLFAGGLLITAGTNYAYGFAEAIIGVATNAPVLAITNADAGNVGLSWPLDHIGWRLQAQRNPAGVGITSNWFTIAGSTNVNATNFPVHPGAGSVFYRLVYP